MTTKIRSSILFTVAASLLMTACGANDPTAPTTQIDLASRMCAAVNTKPVTVLFDTDQTKPTTGTRITKVEWCNSGNVLFSATLTFVKGQFKGNLDQFPLDYITAARGEGDVVLPVGVSVDRTGL
jgi:major membrane immunogen (membrane-anchored lipoprotein)